MTIAVLSPLEQGVLLLWNTGIFLFLVGDFTRYKEMNIKGCFFKISCIMMFVSFSFEFILLMAQSADEGREESIQAGFALLLLFLFSVYVVSQEIHIRRWRKTHISAISIKESLDLLSAGLCYYWPEGQPKLVNANMDKICRTLTGEPLADAVAFWEQLKSGELPGCMESGEKPIYELTDEDSTFSFQHYEIQLNGHTLCELLASDVSEEYRMIKELENKKEHVGHVRKRLKELSKTITRTTAEREVLAAKEKLHDDFGRMLLLSKRTLLEPETQNEEELKTIWKLNIRQLKDEKPERWQRKNKQHNKK